MERRVGGALVDTQNIQPVLHQLVLLIGNGLVDADRVEVARENHVTHVGADAVFKVQAAADVTNMFFDIPDGFTAAAAAAKQGQIVTVSLGMIAGDQTE